MKWYIGERINREISGNTRAEYGKQIVSRLATQLKETYGGRSFNARVFRLGDGYLMIDIEILRKYYLDDMVLVSEYAAMRFKQRGLKA